MGSLGLPLLILCLAILNDGAEEEHKYEWMPYDGWYNNLAHPDWGAAETQLFRRVPPAYSDGVYEPSGKHRPNPIEISSAVFNGSTGLGSYRNRTALLVFFGQQVVEEILDAQRPGCPPEYFNIPIPKDHPDFEPEKAGAIPLLRSRHDFNTGYSPNAPRQQLNEISAWIDGTLMYGANKAWTDALRSLKDGLLKALNDTDSKAPYFPERNSIRLPMANPPPPRDHVLKPIKRFYMLGNPRGNENPFLLTFGILWFRYHNFRARQLKANHPDWNDERLFNEARKWVIAVHQKLVLYDWLPSWLNITRSDYPYKGYNPTVNPGIAAEFQSAAMRFGHTLVPPGVFRRTPDCKFYQTTEATHFKGQLALRTCNTYWNPQEGVDEHDIDALLLGMASQIAEREDMIITPDLRGNVFGPLEFSRRDLMAVNIQRARDHGLPDYNTVRQYYNLPKREKWEDINPELYARDPGIFERLRKVYNDDINNLDLWPAGMMETGPGGPGETFRTIIFDQFRRIRDGDRFWFENYKLNGLFTEEEVAEIHNVTIRDIILAVTNIPDNETLQQNPFFANDLWCPQPFQLSADNLTHLEACTKRQYFEYFSGSEVSYAVSLALLFGTIFICIGALFLMARLHKKRVLRTMDSLRTEEKCLSDDGTKSASEWLGQKTGEREIKINFHQNKQIIVKNGTGNILLRTIDIKHLTKENDNVRVALSADKGMKMISIKIPREYDLVLRFSNDLDKNTFYEEFRKFITSNGLQNEAPRIQTEKAIKTESFTKDKRQEILNSFFRAIFAHAFKYDLDSDEDLNREVAKDVISCELTKFEFSEALALKPTSLFVENMFKIVDKDDNGFISFREFLDMIVIFSKGSADDKAKLMFDMYDLDGSGNLSKEEFKIMIKSMMELAHDQLTDQQVTNLISAMFKDKNLAGKDQISFQDFNKILKDYKEDLQYAQLQLKVDGAPQNIGAREAGITRARKTVLQAYTNANDERLSSKKTQFSKLKEVGEGVSIENKLPKGTLQKTLMSFKRFCETYRLHIFWCSLYTLVLIGIFIERAYYYSIEREHGGLRQIAGYGVTVTRGAASAMMFTYSSLLVTMCRNLITKLRETFVHQYVPLDAAISFHKYIAWWALFFTIMHCIGHSINFYHIATQTADDLSCLFRNFFHATDELPKFHYWLYNTITGFTGVLLTLVVFIMYTFAIQYARRHSFRSFWITHHLYSVLFILMIMHGAGRLVQPPFFHYFFLGPAVLFTLDKLVSVSRRKVQIQVTKADILPSEVTHLRVKKPNNFEYKSGQWVRIAHVEKWENEYHPFTLTSAPHEDWLSLHIRSVGPWTMHLRQRYDPNNLKGHKLPPIYLDGPYGEGHQDWYKYEVAILVGGGIGVTPFASILKDLAHRSKGKEKIKCKKVYFIWVTRTQNQFEWLTDIIREVEENDVQDLVSAHIFITQFKEKFDVRTTMLYICERYFQKISSRSLFTGLRSVTHFGRPNFSTFFQQVKDKHNTDVFGVFSCGPPPMTRAVDESCQKINQTDSESLFVHHFENF